VAKAKPAVARVMVALAPTAPPVASGGRSPALTVALRSQGCEKDQPVVAMSPVPGAEPNGPPPSPLEAVLQPVPPPAGDMTPQTWVVTDRPVPPPPDEGPGGVFVPVTGGGGGGGGGGVFPTGGPTAVPEPGTWAMMLVGFLGVGAALRSTRRRTIAPSAGPR
jgi:hypothetical protein